MPSKPFGRVDVPTELEPVQPKIIRTGSGNPMLETLLEGNGDLLPVSALPVDGTFPTGTAKWEKRSIAAQIPIWDPDICIDCGRCALVCPHSAIRMKAMDDGALTDQPASFRSKVWKGPEGDRMTIQVAPDDCTGCGVCVDICPAKSKTEVKHRAINMEPIAPHVSDERENFDFFLALPEVDRKMLKLESVKGSQLAQPLFEFSGACSGCGETPYVKLLSQLFGDRTLVANATGCSSIYGGNLPTTPWTKDAAGRGPAWANSLFEDNAEFGLGMRLGLDSHARRARALVDQLSAEIGPLAASLSAPTSSDETAIAARRQQIEQLRSLLAERTDPASRELASLADHLVRTDVWIVGGDGWAYDIGFGGVDHVLASGPGRQHPRARHRGLLEHRRADVQGHPSCCRGQVRHRWQDRPQEGPRTAGHGVRKRVRRTGGDGCQHDPDGPSVPRSRSPQGTVAHHRLQPVHRPRHRHDEDDGASEDGSRNGLLAALPVRPGP